MLSPWITVFLMLMASQTYAKFCASWDNGKSIGALSPKDMRETSGMTASRRFPGRVYWINDSGDKGFFQYSDFDGKNLQKVKIAQYDPRDMEAITLTECPQGPCLVIGDIGDNRRRRQEIKILFIAEQKDYLKEAELLRTLVLEYPDGPHDAEALAFLPGGDLWIVTKEILLTRLHTSAAGVYGLSKAEWSAGTGDDSGIKKMKLKKLGELPLQQWLSEDLFFAQAATDMAVNPTRQVLGILTYGKAVEIPLKILSDLGNSAKWKKDRDYSIVPLQALAQQESLTYLADPDRILWSTEYRMPEAPIFSMTCTRTTP